MKIENGKGIPIIRDVGYSFNSISQWQSISLLGSTDALAAGFGIYSRYENPTVAAAEKILCALENAPWAVLTPSGMSALEMAITAALDKSNQKTVLFFSQSNGGTLSLLSEVFEKRRGVNLIPIPYSWEENYDCDVVEGAISSHRGDVVFLETISNPLLIVPDLVWILSLAKRYDCLSVVDNTFAGTILCKPLTLGADLVVNSLTKYVCGHNNLLAGMVCGNSKELELVLRRYRSLSGAICSPDEAERMASQSVTCKLRFERQCQNTRQVLRALQGSAKVERLRCPGPVSVTGSLSGENASRIFGEEALCPVITFELFGQSAEHQLESCEQFIRAVNPEIGLAASLGSYQSTVVHVASFFSESFFKKRTGMLRLSVGIEESDILVHAVQRGLGAA